jgi:signal transduction histidine kinase/CheY-like chemotaxis protein
LKRRISLKTRLIGLLAACLLPTLAVMAWLEWAQYRSLERGVRDDAARQATQLAGEISRLVDGFNATLHAVAASPLARLPDSLECDRYLEQLQLASNGSAAIGITDARGRVTCLSRRVNAQQLHASDRFYFQETVRTRAPATGLFSLGKAAGAKAVHFGYPMLDSSGQVSGIVFSPLNLDWFAQQLSDRRLPAHASVTITDREGTVLVRLPQTRMAGQPLPEDWRARMRAHAPGTVDLADPIDGRAQVVGYVPLGQGPSGLFVTVGVDQALAMQPAREAMLRAVVLLLLGTLVAGAVSWWLAERHLRRPLARLVQVASALRRGELAARVEENGLGDAEFVRLGAALNALGESLQLREVQRDQGESNLRRERDAAAASTRSLSDLLAVASHDLRQPIQSMVLSAALLHQKLKGRPEELAAARLQRSARQLVEMLNGVLNVSQLDAGRVAPEVRPVALGDLVRSVGEEFAESANSAGIALHWSTTPLWVLSDASLLRRVLVNYVSNAIKYTPRGGRVTLACKADAQEVELSVTDSGPGIAPEQQAAVWEEFRQLANPDRDPRKGLGLGLAIVRRIAELLGHTVALQSVPGEGSRFSVHVPLASAGSIDSNDDALPRLRGRLLLIEDDEAVGQAMSDLLRNAGLWVSWCQTAERGLAELERSDADFDAVLADFRLPAQSGLAVLRVAREVWPDIPAVLMTGGMPQSRIGECEAEGITVLMKPLQASQLAKALSALVAPSD